VPGCNYTLCCSPFLKYHALLCYPDERIGHLAYDLSVIILPRTFATSYAEIRTASLSRSITLPRVTSIRSGCHRRLYSLMHSDSDSGPSFQKNWRNLRYILMSSASSTRSSGFVGLLKIGQGNETQVRVLATDKLFHWST
jgi:hypothetical protein